MTLSTDMIVWGTLLFLTLSATLFCLLRNCDEDSNMLSGTIQSEVGLMSKLEDLLLRKLLI